jgi:uncharacterized membrane protein YdbT with pleckstrin-like domain
MSTEQQEQGWFYVDRAQQKQGPIALSALKAMADLGEIGGDTQVWTEGYSYWVPAGEVTGLIEQVSPQPQVKAYPKSAPKVASVPAAPPEAHSVLEAVPEVVSEAAAQEDPLPVEEIKPRQWLFMVPRVVIGLGLSVLVTILVCMGLMVAEISPYSGLFVLILGTVLTVYAALAAYRKERYELNDTTVVCHRGGLVSDQTTELEICNITHVKVKLPWLRYKFFGVGQVSIESAGNAQPVVLRAIGEPEEIYARMTERMKRNGYELTQEQLLHEERPAILGVLIECAGMSAVIGYALVLGLSTIAGFAEDAADFGFSWLPWVLSSIFVAAAVGYLVVHYLDMRRRTYRVYNDVVVYEEGFLTRENAFIPYENIADAATKRSFIDQLLNLYDVVVSCQGSSSSIKFRRLRHGVQLSACIDRLVLEAGAKPTPTPPVAEDTGSAAARAHSRPAEPGFVAPSDAWIADLRMSPARVLVPLLILFPLLPIWILVMIQAGIKIWSTRYAVRPGSIRHSYRFLTTHDREFAYDKITGLVIKENLWDRLFGTVTLRFWSIGSGQSLELAHVQRAALDLDAILRQIGIPAATAPPREVAASFGALTWLRARLYRVTAVLVSALALVVAGVQTGESLFYLLTGVLALLSLAGFGRAWAYFVRQRLRFHSHHVEAEQGIMIRHRYYVRYRNVKKSLVTRYPGGQEGSLQIFAAGEQYIRLPGSTKGQQTVAVPCSFTLGLLPHAMAQGQLLDDILCGRVEPAPECMAAEPPEVLYETRRGVGNSVVSLVLLSVLIFPLILLLPITLPIVILAAKKWRFQVNEGWVATAWGLLYKKQASILLDRVDSLQQGQGLLNKIFKNGSVSIMTAGSSKPDLVMPAAVKHQALYQEIRKLSQGG